MGGAPDRVLRCGYCGAAWDRRYLNCPWCGTFQLPSDREWVKVNRKETEVHHDSDTGFYATLLLFIATLLAVALWAMSRGLHIAGLVFVGFTAVAGLYLLYCAFWEYDRTVEFIAEDGRVFHLGDGDIHELDGDLYMELYRSRRPVPVPRCGTPGSRGGRSFPRNAFGNPFQTMMMEMLI